jgi:hypothetical protein
MRILSAVVSKVKKARRSHYFYFVQRARRLLLEAKGELLEAIPYCNEIVQVSQRIEGLLGLDKKKDAIRHKDKLVSEGKVTREETGILYMARKMEEEINEEANRMQIFAGRIVSDVSAKHGREHDKGEFNSFIGHLSSMRGSLYRLLFMEVDVEKRLKRTE